MSVLDPFARPSTVPAPTHGQGASRRAGRADPGAPLPAGSIRSRARLLLGALSLLALVAPLRAEENPNWNEVARRVVPEVLARSIEFPDFVRVFRRGSATIGITVGFSEGTPGRAEVAFAFHDRNDNGRLEDDEIEWKQRYASSDSIRIGLQDFRRGIFALLTLPPSFTLAISRIDGEETPTGWKFTSARRTDEGDVPLTLYVSKDYVVERGEAEIQGDRSSQRFEYEVHGDRRATTRFLQTSRTREGGGVETDVRFSYVEQEECLLPVLVDTTVRVVTVFGSGMTRVTMNWQDWRGEKRPHVLPRPEADPLRGRPPPPPPPRPDPTVVTPTPRPDRPTPGGEDPRAFLARLDRRYLSLAAGGIDRLGFDAREERTGAFAFAWSGAGGFDTTPFMERRGETDLMAFHEALERNPLFTPFSTLHLSDAARLRREADGAVTVEDPGAHPPVTWSFAADGSLASTRTRLADGEILRTFRWQEAGGGLLLRETSVELRGGARIFDRWTYARFDRLLAPTRILLGAGTPEIGRHAAAEHAVYDFEVNRVQDASGGWHAPEDEAVAAGDPLEGLRLLPGAPPTPPPTPTPPTDLTAADLAARLDEGVERLAAGRRDLAVDLRARRGGADAFTATLYWLAPGRLAVVDAEGGPPLPADVRLALEESLVASPLFVPHAALLSGATVRRLPDGLCEATLPEAPFAPHAIVAAPETGVRRLVRRDAAGQTTATVTRTLVQAGSGSGRLADAVVLTAPGHHAEPLQLLWRYTRAPGFVFAKRLVVEGPTGAPPALEVLFENVRVDAGLAAAWFAAHAPRPGGGLFED